MSDWGISDLYNGLFGSAEFMALDPINSPQLEATVADYHHPGGNDNTVIQTGKRTQTLELTVACTATDKAALESAVNTSATLSYPGESMTALLTRVQAKQHVHFTGIYEVRLSFII
jgi:hypothetical protein